MRGVGKILAQHQNARLLINMPEYDGDRLCRSDRKCEVLGTLDVNFDLDGVMGVVLAETDKSDAWDHSALNREDEVAGLH